MHPDLRLRDATRDDLDAILRLNRDAVPAVGDVDEHAMRRLVEQSVQTLVVEEVAGGGVVAFLVALGPGTDYRSPNYQFFAQRYASFRYVDRVVVDPARARQGIGAALYERVEQAATQDRAAVLTAEVNVVPRNEASLAFHAARGFVAVGEQDTHGGATRVRLLVRDLG